MPKLDPVVRKETLRFGLGTMICTAVMLLVFFLIGKFDLTVLYGGLLGGGFAVFNFFLLGLSVQRTTSQEDAKKAQAKMQMSYTLRLLLMAAVVIVGIQLPCFHWVAVVVPLIFPRLIIFFLGIKPKRKGVDE